MGLDRAARSSAVSRPKPQSMSPARTEDWLSGRCPWCCTRSLVKLALTHPEASRDISRASVADGYGPGAESAAHPCRCRRSPGDSLTEPSLDWNGPITRDSTSSGCRLRFGVQLFKSSCSASARSHCSTDTESMPRNVWPLAPLGLALQSLPHLWAGLSKLTAALPVYDHVPGYAIPALSAMTPPQRTAFELLGLTPHPNPSLAAPPEVDARAPGGGRVPAEIGQAGAVQSLGAG